MYDWNESPPGYVLARFRQSIMIEGNVCTQARFAESIGISTDRQSSYEQEKDGRRMPAPIWAYARIMWDSLALAEWQKQRPRRE